MKTVYKHFPYIIKLILIFFLLFIKISYCDSLKFVPIYQHIFLEFFTGVLIATVLSFKTCQAELTVGKIVFNSIVLLLYLFIVLQTMTTKLFNLKVFLLNNQSLFLLGFFMVSNLTSKKN